MTEKPLISVCVPVYNGGTYLEACLESILAQTLDDYEIIVVDDGSGDNSVSIIEKSKEINAHLKFYKNERNLGLVGNWNRCLELATGKWIKFVFQDDLIAPTCLEKMMQAAADSQALVVCQRHFLIEENAGEYLKNYFNNDVLTLEKIFDGKVPGFLPARNVSRLAVNYLTVNFIGEPTCVMFKHTLVERLGNFNTDLAQICDLEYNLRIATQYGIKYVHEPLASFRIHSTSSTATTTATKKFTSSFADPAILCYKLLHDSFFDGFRHSVSYFSRLRLRAYFQLKVYEAHLFLASEAGRGAEMESQILKKYPGFENGKTPGLLTKIIYLLVRQRRSKKV
jgi:glycosyltransferase involved in cell wall biosynthesis